MIKINFTAQNISWSPAMEEYSRHALDKIFNRLAIPLETTFTIKASIIDKKTKMIKVELSGANFRAQCVNKDFYAAMTSVANKFKSLILKQNKKYITKKKHAALAEDLVSDFDVIENLVTKEKVFIIDSCDLATAIKKFEQTDYSFYIFKEVDSNDEMAVLYRRADDTFGIIRCK